MLVLCSRINATRLISRACLQKAVERIIKIKGINKAKEIQVGFIALNKQGEHGAYCIQTGFNYAVCYSDKESELVDAKYFL